MRLGKTNNISKKVKTRHAHMSRFDPQATICIVAFIFFLYTQIDKQDEDISVVGLYHNAIIALGCSPKYT